MKCHNKFEQVDVFFSGIKVLYCIIFCKKKNYSVHHTFNNIITTKLIPKMHSVNYFYIFMIKIREFKMLHNAELIWLNKRCQRPLAKKLISQIVFIVSEFITLTAIIRLKHKNRIWFWVTSQSTEYAPPLKSDLHKVTLSRIVQNIYGIVQVQI